MKLLWAIFAGWFEAFLIVLMMTLGFAVIRLVWDKCKKEHCKSE